MPTLAGYCMSVHPSVLCGTLLSRMRRGLHWCKQSVGSACGKPSVNLSTVKLIAVAIVIASLLYNGTNQSSNGNRATAYDASLVYKETNLSSNGDRATPNDDGMIIKKATNQSADDDSCYHLLNDGIFIPGDIWKPQGCSVREYSSVEFGECMKAAANSTGKTSRLYFLGNSRVRQLYTLIIEQLGAKIIPSADDKMTMPNFIYNVSDLQLEAHYFWRELVNEEITIDLIERIKRQPPSLVVIGSVLHYFVNYGIKDPTAATDYRAGITRLVKELDQLPGTFPVLYMLPEAVNIKTSAPFWNNTLIEEYNQVAIEVFESTRVTVVQSVRLIGLFRMWDYFDGIHTTPATVKYYVQIVFNFFCNRYVDDAPPDTCCGPSAFLPTTPVVLSYATAFAAWLCLFCFVLLLVGLFSWKRWLLKTPSLETASNKEFDFAIEKINTDSKTGHSSAFLLNTNDAVVKHHSEHLIEEKTRTIPNLVQTGALISWKDGAVCLLKLALIMGYFILCDRVNFFNKGHKQFSLVAFATPLGLALLVAIWSRKPSTIPDPEQLTLLRDITEEWKGWMQLVLLVYHVTGASQQLPIYTHVRVLVASYLFLTGYGHFTSFWKNGKAVGFAKYFQTIFRLNFLTVLLCVFMNQPYMNYYFTALVSFWYTAVYVVMALPPWIDVTSPDRTFRDFGCGAFKIVVLTVMIALLSYSEEVFQNIFGAWPLSTLFHLPPEAGVKEWRFRWMLDRFSVLYGMVFALMCQAWSNIRVPKASCSVWPESKTGTALLGLASLFGLSSYAILLHYCDGKVACNSWHPYLTWIPILGYILFRHHSTVFRAHFSPLFAWLGRISLELFVSQYHVLLANNTTDVLILVPGPRLVNTVATALVFLSVADEVNAITSTVQTMLVPNDAGQLLTRGVALLALAGALFAYRTVVLFS